MKTLRSLADVEQADSFSNRMRSRRFARFEALASTLDRPLRIIDIGGTNEFWRQRGYMGRDDVRITLVNLEPEEQVCENIEPHRGDATNLSGVPDRSFDVAFSNSVIEHVFTLENQRKMARETQRVSRAHWVQTPNFWFPIEPHFLTPAWHWLPRTTRAALLRRRRFGQRGPCPDPEEARAMVEEIRLMTRRELRSMFPESRIMPERFCGLVKSWVCYGGFPE